MTSHAEPVSDHGHDHHRPPARASELARGCPGLGMFLFIASEAMLFGSFFMAYFFVRVVNPSAPETWPPEPTTSRSSWRALTRRSWSPRASRCTGRSSRSSAATASAPAGMVLTFMMGLTFLLTQAVSTSTSASTPSDGAFASVFFGLTGLHGAHVFVGLTLLGMVIVRGFRGHFSPSTTTASSCPGSTGTLSTSCGSSSMQPFYSDQGSGSLEKPVPEEAAAFRFLLITISAPSLDRGCRPGWIRGSASRRSSRSPRLRSGCTSVNAPGAAAQARRALWPPDVKRVLVVANETVGGEELMQVIGDIALTGQTEFFAVCPALNSRLKTWTSDEDGARAAAEKRLVRLSPALRRRDRGPGVGRDLDPLGRDRGCGTDLPSRRDRDLHASRRALELARARGRAGCARPVRRARHPCGRGSRSRRGRGRPRRPWSQPSRRPAGERLRASTPAAAPDT